MADTLTASGASSRHGAKGGGFGRGLRAAAPAAQAPQRSAAVQGGAAVQGSRYRAGWGPGRGKGYCQPVAPELVLVVGECLVDLAPDDANRPP
ncbi:MAG: hypothetical protein ACYCXN_08225, partial [Acidimicrobiales bacterium]